jgi:hypothetical protein
MSKALKLFAPILAIASALHAAPDISNLNNCINEVRLANATPPAVPTFDQYTRNYRKLLIDLNTVTPTLPYVYQEAAARPLIRYLTNLGELQYLQIFAGISRNPNAAVLKDMIPDASLAILFHNSVNIQGVNAFQEIISDLYNSFISDELRTTSETGVRIDPPTYGIIPPLVKYGNAENGPYTWPGNATSQVLGLRCAIVSLPPAQLKGGLLAWSSLGHETGGHDILHADAGLINELAQKISAALMTRFGSQGLANYWAAVTDEATSDALGYLHLGPSAGIGLVGYFRSLGNGKLRNIGPKNGPHPIDLLRGYLAAAVAKRLNFKDAAAWSQTIYFETAKDNNLLYLVDQRGVYSLFPVSLDQAIASTEVVAEVILTSNLNALQGHSLLKITKGWTDADQDIVNSLVAAINTTGQLPLNVRGPGFYAAHAVSAATEAGLKFGANIPLVFNSMVNFLATMHQENPTWSLKVTTQSQQLVDRAFSGADKEADLLEPILVYEDLPEEGEFLDDANEDEEGDHDVLAANDD